MHFDSVADVLDASHDELLLHGWCREFLETSRGEHCALGAISAVLNLRSCDGELHYPDGDDMGAAAFQALRAVLPPIPPEPYCRPLTEVLSVTHWNDEVAKSIDDVLDAYRRASKAVREAS